MTLSEKELYEQVKVLIKKLSKLINQGDVYFKIVKGCDSYKDHTSKQFDPDSSPYAWKHYENLYKKHWNRFSKDDHAVKYLIENYDLQPDGLKNNRLYNKKENVFGVAPSLSGETDINLKMGHYTHFANRLETIAKNDGNLSKETKAEISNLLNGLTKLHHTLVNFSLMQSMGRLQQYKKTICGERIDTFIYDLNILYNLCASKINGEIESLFMELINMEGKNLIKQLYIMYPESKENIIELLNYLMQFQDIYDYCEKIYFLEKDYKIETSKLLVDALIESGDKPLDSANRVIEYIKLAIDFWNAKLTYFNQIDTNNKH